MASASSFRVDQRIAIAGKGLGTIAFIGKPEFADGEWIGVILDEPKGKNNGSVRKKDGNTVQYFSCAENHGLYVRPSQIESVVNDSKTHLPQSTSNQSVKSQNGSAGHNVTKAPGLPSKQTGIQASASTTSRRPSGSTRTILPANGKTPVPEETVVRSPTPESSSKPITTVSSSELSTSDSQQSINDLNSKITDQEEQIQTLIHKRREDVQKLSEFEHMKRQYDQLQANKREAQERMQELADQLQQRERELREAQDKFAAYRDEMADTETRIESLTLDLEIGEEKLELLTAENTALKEKLEEAQLELDVVKSEIQLNGSSSLQKKPDDERIIKLEQALVQLRNLVLTERTDKEAWTKQCHTLAQRVEVLTEENDNAKTDATTMQATIADLKEQVDTYASAQQMADLLTTRNLSLEEQLREFQETVENLESICDINKEMEETSQELEKELRQTVDSLQNQAHEKDCQIEQLHYTIADHERTILKFRESLKNMQSQNDEVKKQLSKYDEQFKLAGAVQSSEFKAKIIENKTYGELIEGELRRIEVYNLSQHVQFLILFLPVQLTKRGADYECILLFLLIQRLASKCDLVLNEVPKKVQRIDQLTLDDVMKSHRADQWSFACQLSQSVAIFRMILRKYLKVLDMCNADTLRRSASAYRNLLTQEKALDLLIELLAKDQLHDSISLNALDKTAVFYDHVYKSHFDEQRFSMVCYLRDFVRVVLFSSDALQTDIQRVQLLHKAGSDQTPFVSLIKRLIESNDQVRAQATKIYRLLPQEDDQNRSLMLDANTVSSIESSIQHLNRLTNTFREICSHLINQILILSNPNEWVSIQEIESIAYQACDKVYQKEDSGPYDSLWNSMFETVTTLTKLGNSLETGVFESSTNEAVEKPKQAVYVIADQFQAALRESDSMRGRLQLKEEELLELRKMLKLKQDELDESGIRLTLNDKKLDTLSKQFDEETTKYIQNLEQTRINAQKEIRQCEETIAVLQSDNDKLEQEISALQERFKQQPEPKHADDSIHKRFPTAQKTSAPLYAGLTIDNESNAQRQISTTYDNHVWMGSASNEHEVTTLRNTIRLLKDELWQVKMAQTSSELTKLPIPSKDNRPSEMTDIYKSSTLLLNDLFSTIANYKITGENVAIKQELLRSKMKLVDQTASNLKTRLHECQSHVLPGSTIQTAMTTFPHPQFAKSLIEGRQLAAELQLPGDHSGGDFDLTGEQYCRIMREALGCV